MKNKINNNLPRVPDKKCAGCRKFTNYWTLTWRDGLEYCKACIEHIWRQEYTEGDSFGKK